MRLREDCDIASISGWSVTLRSANDHEVLAKCCETKSLMRGIACADIDCIRGQTLKCNNANAHAVSERKRADACDMIAIADSEIAGNSGSDSTTNAENDQTKVAHACSQKAFIGGRAVADIESNRGTGMHSCTAYAQSETARSRMEKSRMIGSEEEAREVLRGQCQNRRNAKDQAVLPSYYAQNSDLSAIAAAEIA